MAFTLKIETGNAAFGWDQTVEIARILRQVAENIVGEPGSLYSQFNIRDINGNTVGSWTLDPREDN
jgi:hypothetical protein